MHIKSAFGPSIATAIINNNLTCINKKSKHTEYSRYLPFLKATSNKYKILKGI